MFCVDAFRYVLVVWLRSFNLTVNFFFFTLHFVFISIWHRQIRHILRNCWDSIILLMIVLREGGRELANRILNYLFWSTSLNDNPRIGGSVEKSFKHIFDYCTIVLPIVFHYRCLPYSFGFLACTFRNARLVYCEDCKLTSCNKYMYLKHLSANLFLQIIGI